MSGGRRCSARRFCWLGRVQAIDFGNRGFIDIFDDYTFAISGTLRGVRWIRIVVDDDIRSASFASIKPGLDSGLQPDYGNQYCEADMRSLRRPKTVATSANSQRQSMSRFISIALADHIQKIVYPVV